jgi:hypothetical protein
MKWSYLFPALLFTIVAAGAGAQCTNQCQHNRQRVMMMGSMLDDPGNLRSDTLDILKYTITLDMTQMNSSEITASCEVRFKCTMDGIDWINLDLLGLTVDSFP